MTTIGVVVGAADPPAGSTVMPIASPASIAASNATLRVDAVNTPAGSA